MNDTYSNLFTGSSILVNRLQFLLQEKGIASIIKDPIQSATLAGFGAVPNSISLHVAQNDMEIAQNVLSEFKMTLEE